MMQWPGGRILLRHELDAFLAQAVSNQLYEPDQLQELKVMHFLLTVTQWPPPPAIRASLLIFLVLGLHNLVKNVVVYINVIMHYYYYYYQ